MTESSTAVGDTSIGWKQRGAGAGLYQLKEPVAHTGSLKLAKARTVYTAEFGECCKSAPPLPSPLSRYPEGWQGLVISTHAVSSKL